MPYPSAVEQGLRLVCAFGLLGAFGFFMGAGYISALRGDPQVDDAIRTLLRAGAACVVVVALCAAATLQ